MSSSCSTQTPKTLLWNASEKIKLKDQLTIQKEKFKNLQVKFKKLQKAKLNASSLYKFNLL